VDELTNAIYDFEIAVTDAAKHKYVLQLYIAGATPRSLKAVKNVQKICKESLKDIYELQVIDIFQQPYLAKAEQIFAVPTLIKKLPIPKRLFIGDMSDTITILANLDL